MAGKSLNQLGLCSFWWGTNNKQKPEAISCHLFIWLPLVIKPQFPELAGSGAYVKQVFLTYREIAFAKMTILGRVCLHF